jgi:hypothetical protein
MSGVCLLAMHLRLDGTRKRPRESVVKRLNMHESATNVNIVVVEKN